MFEHKQSFDTFVATQLNHEQKTAVQAKDGSFLVIAGAGSGKTRVITARITNLILNHNVEPSSIIALTFTNKAAQEMQHRIEQFLPTLRTKPTIATFHAYCLKLLKKHHFLNNLPDFSVIDAQYAHKLLQSIVKEKGLEKLFNSKQLLSFFSNFKDGPPKLRKIFFELTATEDKPVILKSSSAFPKILQDNIMYKINNFFISTSFYLD